MPGEVESRARVLAEWIRTRQEPDCRHEQGRCNRCGLGAFCDQLEEYVKDEVLKPLPDPPCLARAGRPSAKALKKTADPRHVVGFVLRHRLFAKTTECRDCAYEPTCEGLPLSETFRRMSGKPAKNP